VRAFFSAALVGLMPALLAGTELELDAEALARGQALLAPYATKDQLSKHLGTSPFLCAPVGAEREICTWKLGNRDPAWSALAASLPTEDRINVVCELATSGGELSAEDCSIHPRRSNRYGWKPNRGSKKQRMKSTSQLKREKRERRERATAMLAEAGTALELSRLVGQGPDGCIEGDAALRRCVWYATSHTWGHGTLMMVIDGSVHDKVRMTCELPAAGSRGPETCDIQVGAAPSP